MTSDSPPDGGTVEVPTWEEVARSHGRFIYTVAYRLTGNHDEAQDLVQEVLLRVRTGARQLPARVHGGLVEQDHDERVPR